AFRVCTARRIRQREEAAMQEFIGFTGIASAILASVGLALALEWLSLRGLMRLMPGIAPGLATSESLSADRAKEL
ncbi:MAG: hypothetical protein WBD66_07945, partial [Candidatus Acidiferrales bacterium]